LLLEERLSVLSARRKETQSAIQPTPIYVADLLARAREIQSLHGGKRVIARTRARCSVLDIPVPAIYR
jgi:hypothetical protein